MRKILTFCLGLFAVHVFAHDNYSIDRVWQKAYSQAGTSDSLPTDITEFNDFIYFIADDNNKASNGVSGSRHLYKLDPKTNEFTIVPFPNGESTHAILDLALVNNELYFKDSSDVYKFNENNTVQAVGYDFIFDTEAWAMVAGKLYIILDLDNGRELYEIVNGTPELVRDINAGEADGVVSDLAIYKNELYFSATDGSNNILYKLTPENNILSPVFSVSSNDNVSIPNVVSNSQFLFYNLVNDYTRVIKFDGTSDETIYQAVGTLEQFSVSDSHILLWGESYGPAGECNAVDPQYSSTLVDLSENSAVCIWSFSSLDLIGGIQDYHFDEQYLILDSWVSWSSVDSGSSKRTLRKVNLKTNQASILYQYPICDLLSGEQSFECKASNFSSAASDGELYSMSNAEDLGLELVSINVASEGAITIDINSFIGGYYNLRAIKAERNLLFLQPYLNDTERVGFAREYLVYDYFGETNSSSLNWQQGESFLYREGLGEYIQPFNFTPDSLYYKGRSYVPSYNREIAAFTRDSKLYWLDATNSQLTLFQTQNNNKIRFIDSDIDDRKVLDVDLTDFNNNREPILNGLSNDSFYFILPYSSGVERLYQYKFEANTTALLEEYNDKQIRLMTSTDDAVYMLKQDSESFGLYQIVGDELTLIDTLFSADKEAGLKELNGDIYYIGVRTSGQLPTLYKWSTLERKVVDVLASRNALTPQSFSYFDDKLFFIAQEQTTETFDLFSLSAGSDSVIKHDLGDGISKPFDVIRYARGLYFQAENSDGISSLYSLTIDDALEFPTVESSEAKAIGYQGNAYISSFRAKDLESDDVDVFVLEPSWLSYNKEESQFEGTVPQEFSELGDKEVTAVVDDGDLLTMISYPLHLEDIIRLPLQYPDFYNAKQPARFGKKWRVKLNFRKNLDTGDALNVSLKAVRVDTREEVNWLTYDNETQEISGFIPNLDIESVSLEIEVIATKGAAVDSQKYNVDIEPLITVNQVLSQPTIDVEKGSSVQHQIEYVTDNPDATITEYTLSALGDDELPEFISIDEGSGLLTISPPETFTGSNIKFGVTSFSNLHGYAIYAEGEIRFNQSSTGGSSSNTSESSGSNTDNGIKKSGGAFYFVLLLLPLAFMRRMIVVR